MSDESGGAAGTRFARDLRRIRTDRNVSVDDIHEHTQIPLTLIESFEEGELYDHPTFNEVYLRSFVQAYAEAIGVAPDAALTGLDAALNGTYQHSLADQYLDAAELEDMRRKAEEDSAPGDEELSSDATESSSADAGAGDMAEAAGDSDGDGAMPAPPERPPLSLSSDEKDGENGGQVDGSAGEDGIVGPPRATDDQEEKSSEPTLQEEAGPNTEEITPAGDGSPSDEENASALDPPASTSAEEDDSSTDTNETKPGPGASSEPSWMGEEAPDGETKGVPDGNIPTPTVEEPSLGRSEGMGIVGDPTTIGEDGAEEGERTTATPHTNESSARPSSRIQERVQVWVTSRPQMLLGLGAALLFVVSVGIGLVIFLTGDEVSGREGDPTPSRTTEAVTPVPSDTTAVDSADATSSPPPPADVRLDETMHMTMQADSNVARILVQRDDDLRRPYWLQRGERAMFPFARRIVVQNELDDVSLFLEGYPYPVSPDSQGRVLVDRDVASAFVDTLRGSPQTWSSVPDTIPTGSPPPDTTGAGP